MKQTIIKAAIGFWCMSALVSTSAFAGNSDRIGQAGATELLINPWARNSGLANSNSASVTGLEATFLNVAGTAINPGTELIFVHTDYLEGAGIGINAFGFTQKVGETGALSLSVMSMNFGQIPVTTVDQPEGTGITFSPSFVNMGLSYAKGFSDNIYGGVTMRVISEAISNVQAQGVALDAGIQYVTGRRKQIHFGVALKNVGPTMRYTGDGLSFTTLLPQNNPSGTQTFTVEERSAAFELPTMMNMGVTYDFYFAKDSVSMRTHRLSVSGNFISNSFGNDQFGLGTEYAFRNFLMLRLGYLYEKGIMSSTDRMTVFTGPTAGLTLEIPLRNKSSFGFDYSYRATDPFQGVHTFGVRLKL